MATGSPESPPRRIKWVRMSGDTRDYGLVLWDGTEDVVLWDGGNWDFWASWLLAADANGWHWVSMDDEWG